MMAAFDRLDRIPEGLAGLEPREIRKALPRPALIELDGRGGAPLFLSVLLHGNETTGFFVLQRLAARFARHAPERPMMILVGNVEATEQGVRYCAGQPDFNRVWAGGDSAFHAMAADIAERAAAARPFASIDIHNNTGRNPHYGCVNRLEPPHLALAGLFAPTGVYYTNPRTTQSMAFSRFCPAVTIECGAPASAPGVARATDFVLDVLGRERLATGPKAPAPDNLYRTVGRVVLASDAEARFDDTDAPISLSSAIEALNFSAAPAGLAWARSRGAQPPLAVIDEAGRDLTDRFFEHSGGVTRLTRDTVPAMFTTDLDVIRKDCLAYLMEPCRLPEAART